MPINLSAIFSAPAGVITNQISYARIDNTTNPVFIQAGNFAISPAVIASNIPSGQYIVNILPIYPDGRVCTPTSQQTMACPGLNSISGYISGGVLVVQYNAPSTVPNVRITVGFPNGGSNVSIYANTGNNIAIPIPAGLTGNFTIQGQSVCDATSGFYSSLSSTVNVSLGAPVAGIYTLGNTAGSICNGTPGTLYTNGAFSVGSILFTDIGLSNAVTGFSYVVYNNALYLLDATSGTVGNPTGNTCNATISGITGLNPGNPVGSGNIYAPAGYTVHVAINAGGTSGGTYTTQINIPSLSISQSVTNGTNTFTFVMPPAGSVAWNGSFVSSGGTGGGTISVS
jgi:hypothetical protein